MLEIASINLFLLVLGIYIAKIILVRKKNTAPLPPGPKPKPIVGNITDLPPSGEQEWQHWLKHKDLYGPISSVTIFGQTIIILNDSQMAFELLEKRSALSSSRPRMVFGGEMVGWEHSLAAQIYSSRFRSHRKNIYRILGSKSAVARFNSLQDIEIRRFLLRVLEKPEDVLQHIRTEAGATILKIAYGYTIEPRKRDPLVDLADKALEQFSHAVVPGAWLVDIIPYLRYLPDWLPGTGFRRTASHWRKTLTDLVEKPYAFVRQQMAQGKNEPSYLSKLLENNNGNLSTEEDFVAKWSAASLYAGGADTTVSSMSCFFLAMILYPEVQRKAQEEIDRVVGTRRLPSFDDRGNLPYVEAIVKEVLRWHPVAPMGLPHMTTDDIIFDGYLIPKGALIIPNIWGFTHDPKIFHNPMTFKPERFLGLEDRDPEPDPHTLSFGFGRRICPGRVLADTSVYLTIAQSLAVFNISKAVENGKEIDPIIYFQPGIISHPTPYKTFIKPRSPDHEALIHSIAVEHPWQESDSKYL